MPNLGLSSDSHQADPCATRRRNWHSSFNRWLVRYMYIPLGGARFKAANIWAIFTFVAVWHDVDLRLLVWAWVSCLFAGPEILAKWIARCPAVRPWKDSWQFRHLCAVAAAVNIVVLMVRTAPLESTPTAPHCL